MLTCPEIHHRALGECGKTVVGPEESSLFSVSCAAHTTAEKHVNARARPSQRNGSLRVNFANVTEWPKRGRKDSVNAACLHEALQDKHGRYAIDGLSAFFCA